jgi:chitin disaccharide deacetylase
MLIINADDFGRNAQASNNIIECFKMGGITCTSIMVFMNDSRRAAESASKCDIDIGLHINFTEEYTGTNVPGDVQERHNRVRGYLLKSKWASIIYNPFIRKDICDCFNDQCIEYNRIIGRMPYRYDGHHHVHLCSNMIIDHVIPYGACVRRSFTFKKKEKSVLNRFYRRIVDWRIQNKYICCDEYYALSGSNDNYLAIRNYIQNASIKNIELSTHPEIAEQFNYLTNPQYIDYIRTAKTGIYSLIKK